MKRRLSLATAASAAVLVLAGCGGGSTTHVTTTSQSGPTGSTSSSSTQSGKSNSSSNVNIAEQNLNRSLKAMRQVTSLTLTGTTKGASGEVAFSVSSAKDGSCQGKLQSQQVGTVEFALIGKLEYINAGTQFWTIGLPGQQGKSIIPKISGSWVAITLKGTNEFTRTCAIVQAYKTNYLSKTKYLGITNLGDSGSTQTVGVRSPGIIFQVSTQKPYYLLGEKTSNSNLKLSNFDHYDTFSPPKHFKSIVVSGAN